MKTFGTNNTLNQTPSIAGAEMFNATATPPSGSMTLPEAAAIKAHNIELKAANARGLSVEAYHSAYNMKSMG